MANERNPLTDRIKKYIQDNPRYLTEGYQEVADKFKASYEKVRHVARSLRNKAEKTTEVTEEKAFSITDEVLIRKENAMIKSLKRRLEDTISEYDKLSDMYDVALALKTQEVDRTIPEIKANSKSVSEAAAIVSLSDGHFGKVILKSTVNGLNEYNESIARKRMDTLAENTIKLISKERQSIKIDNLVLGLGGDFLDNSQLHEHGEMSTPMSPMEETMFARELLSKYIRTIAEHGNFKKIHVICVRGNHPRITKKMSAAVDYRMNYETILYSILKSEFNSSLFEWNIPDSDIAEMSIFGYKIRSIHGHQCRYGGGIGGLTIPLQKYLLRQDQISPVYHTLLHHFHNYSFPTSHSTLNGSVCGMDPYAFSLGCEFQEPMQSFMLLDKNKGLTIKAPIFAQ